MKNKETIYRQDAIDALGERPMVWTDDDDYALGERNQYDMDKLAIETVPSAQPDIIRCAECKWFQCNMGMDGYLPKGVDEYECRHWCGSCDPVDFCSHAERRKEGDE